MTLLPVAEALRRVLEGAEPLPAEWVPLADAHGRVLAADLVALRTQPPADVSAMDGYAVRGEDVASGKTRLKVIGEVAAGRPFEGRVGPGEAARIYTGGLLPPGADTVVVQERTVREGEIVIVQPTEKGRNIRREGLDFRAGDRLLTKGRRLTSRDLALAAAMNHATVPVHRRPRVAMIATGDELIAPGLNPGREQIVYSNGFALGALARAEGAEAEDLGIVPDRLDATVAAIERAKRAGVDVLVTAGGASVGEYDLVQQALASQGMTLSFWRIAMRPGRPMLHGRLGPIHVLGVPGNPVSAFVCALLFLTPLLRRLAGRTDLAPEIESAVLGCALPANDERADYLRATLTIRDGIKVATPFPLQDSSMLGALARADCLIVREPHAPPAEAGSLCSIIKLGL